jgi:hypothetical protein
MTTYTTGQVAKLLGITKKRVHAMLTDYPGLRPTERDSNARDLLWSENELAALRAHIESHPFISKPKHSKIK